MHAVPQTGRSTGPATHAKPGATPTDPAAFSAVLKVAAKSAATPAKPRHGTATAAATPTSSQHVAAPVPAFALFQLPHPVPDQKPAAHAASPRPATAVTEATAAPAAKVGATATPSRPATHAAAADATIATSHPATAAPATAAPVAPVPAATQDTTRTEAASRAADKVPPVASAPAAAAQLPQTPAPAEKLITVKTVPSDKPAAIVAATPSLPTVPPPAALAGLAAPATSAPRPAATVTTPPAVSTVPEAAVIAATPAALAASITAMHRNGQTSALLRLDPPGLGTLSIHLALGHEESGGAGQVNLLMVPAVTQTAQLLNSGIDSLRQALAAAGLSLGQAQIGQGGQGGQNPVPDRQPASNRTAPSAPSSVTEIATNSPGVRAYA